MYNCETISSHRLSRTGLPARLGRAWWGRVYFAVALYMMVLSAVDGYAQQSRYPERSRYAFEHLTVADGLPENSVASLIQDSLGFLWMGTQRGLVRYDGYDLRSYAPHPDSPDSLRAGWVPTLFEDGEGRLWVGTGMGLSRYIRETDSFKRYLNLEDANWNMTIREDQSGDLWVGLKDKMMGRNPVMTKGGLYRYVAEEDSFVAYRHDASEPSSLSHHRVETIYEDSRGRLWIGTAVGLDRFETDTHTFTRFTPDPEKKNSHVPTNGDTYANAVTSIVEDDDGRLWLGTWNGLYRFHPETQQFARFGHDPHDPSSLSDDRITTVHVDHEGVLWIATWGGGLNRMGPEEGTFSQLEGLAGGRVSSLYEDRAGTLWIGLWSGFGGLFSYDTETQHLRRHAHDVDDPESFSGGSVFTLYEDRSGILWIGTWLEGLNKLDRGRRKFTAHRHIPGRSGGLSDRMAGAFYVSPAEPHVLWIGTQKGGLNRLDRRSGTYTYYVHDPDDAASLSHNGVTSIAEDYDGALWIGTMAGLNRFDREAGTFERYQHDPADPHSLSPGGVSYKAILVEKEQVWVGTFGGGLNRFDRETGTFAHFRHDPQAQHTLSSDEVLFLYKDRRGTLWVGSNLGGLDRYDRQTESFTRYGLDLARWIHEDRAGRLWVAPFFRGLCQFDRSAERFGDCITEEDGLPYGHVKQVLEDEAGALWIGTDRGLVRYDPETGTARIYSEQDGVTGNPGHHAVAPFRSHTGEMFWGTGEGFISFHPTRLRDNPYEPQVVLTDFELFGASTPVSASSSGRHIAGDPPLREHISVADTDGAEGRGLLPPLLREHISVADTIVLRHDQNDFSFAFAALSFRHPENNRYRYRMEGYDHAWREAGTRREAAYMNLPPGTYAFRVQGSNNDGVWSTHEAAVHIVILPPWWRSTLAYVLYGVALAGLLVVLNRLYRHRILRRSRQAAVAREIEQAGRIRAMNEELLRHEEQLERQNTALEEQTLRLAKMDELKSRFFANISHEFRTPLTLILGPLQELLDGRVNRSRFREHAQLMHRNAAKLLSLVNQLLDLSKLDSGRMQLRPRPVDLVPFLRQQVLAFTARAEREGLSLTFSAEVESMVLEFDPEQLEKVVSNLLSNAMKFTPPRGRVDVELHAPDEGAELRVVDTGSGIAAEEQQHVFDRFYQADSSSARRGDGTGIGLALAKELVELHGGTIGVESEPGSGTTFSVWLPSSPPAGVPRPPSQRAGSRPAKQELSADRLVNQNVLNGNLRPLPLDGIPAQSGETPDSTILLVDDNSDMRAFLRGCLQGRYHVLEARDGEEGLRFAREHVPDLVIADVMMPEMDGFELCDAIKSDHTLDHLPVVLLTARADEESRIEGLERGADDYLAKPFSVHELGVRVENLIEIRQRLCERYSEKVRLGPEEILVPSADAAFTDQLRAAVGAHMGDSNFGVDWLAAEVNLSTRQLHRRVKEVTGLTPGGFIRMMRLESAAQFLEQEAGQVSEIAYAVGFNDPNYFSRLFKQTFGCSPSEYTSKHAA